MKPSFMQCVREDKGFAMVEFAITIPIYIMAVFCFLQLVLIVHAKFMLTYGAFVATRAAVVYNAHEGSMKQAFLSVMTPYFGRIQEDADSYFSDMLNPFSGNSEFEKAYDKAKTDWNDNHFNLTVISSGNAHNSLKHARVLADVMPDFTLQVLKVEASWDFPLVIPVANRLFYYFLQEDESVSYNGLDPGSYLAPPTNPVPVAQLRIPLKSQYTLRLSGINPNNPYHS